MLRESGRRVKEEVEVGAAGDRAAGVREERALRTGPGAGRREERPSQGSFAL